MLETKTLYIVHIERRSPENKIQNYQHIDVASSQVLSSRMFLISDATLGIANSRVKIYM